MAKVEIYTWKTCPFCRRAKQLLDILGTVTTCAFARRIIIYTPHGYKLRFCDSNFNLI